MNDASNSLTQPSDCHQNDALCSYSGCSWPETHDDHFRWVSERWTGRCTCGHFDVEHNGSGLHECKRARCLCQSFYPMKYAFTNQIGPTRAWVIESGSSAPLTNVTVIGHEST